MFSIAGSTLNSVSYFIIIKKIKGRKAQNIPSTRFPEFFRYYYCNDIKSVFFPLSRVLSFGAILVVVGVNS